jgi:hypothetical protein
MLAVKTAYANLDWTSHTAILNGFVAIHALQIPDQYVNAQGVAVVDHYPLSMFYDFATMEQVKTAICLFNTIEYHPIRPRVEKYDKNYY